MTRDSALIALRQDAEPIVEAFQDLCDIEHSRSCGCKFECQCDAVQPPTDLGHQRCAGRVQQELGIGGLGTLGKELHGLAPADRIERRLPVS